MESKKDNTNGAQKTVSDSNTISVEKGLDNWNERLDENLEPKEHNDVEADEKAKEFSEKYGSGDQSDEADS